MAKKVETSKPRLNIIDYALILIALALCVFIGFKIANYRIEIGNGLETKSVKIGIEVGPLRSELKNCVAADDAVYFDSDGKELGYVKYTSDSDVVYTGINSLTGKTVSTSVKDRFVLNLLLTAEAQKGEDGYIINGNKVALGSEIKIRTKNFFGTGTVVSVEEVVE